MRKSRSGFTIVELLIVIVVIGILAAITIVAYNGVQDRALETRRLSDMTTITKALELYKIQNGEYPPVQSNSSGTWERSAVNPDNFLSALKTADILNNVPVDPINNAPDGSTGAENTFTSYTYFRYPAGYYGCDTSLGYVYVLKIEAPGKPRMDASPGMSCGTIHVLNAGSNIGTPYWSGHAAKN